MTNRRAQPPVSGEGSSGEMKLVVKQDVEKRIDDLEVVSLGQETRLLSILNNIRVTRDDGYRHAIAWWTFFRLFLTRGTVVSVSSAAIVVSLMSYTELARQTSALASQHHLQRLSRETHLLQLIFEGCPSELNCNPMNHVLVRTRAAQEYMGLQAADDEVADLSQGNFDRGNFRESTLNSLFMIRGSVREADFSFACLGRAWLRYVDATDAVFFKADLRRALIGESDLRGANLFCARLGIGDVVNVIVNENTTCPDGTRPYGDGEIVEDACRNHLELPSRCDEFNDPEC